MLRIRRIYRKPEKKVMLGVDVHTATTTPAHVPPLARSSYKKTVSAHCANMSTSSDEHGII